MKDTLRILSMAALLVAIAVSPVFAAGEPDDPEETVVDIPRQPRVYIAPENPDAEHTELQLHPEVVPAPDRVIKAYELVIYDEGGDQVYSQEEEVVETRGFFGNLFNIGEVPQIDPQALERLTWDGTDYDGNFVPEGDYIYQLFVVDDEGRTFRTPPQSLTVDNTPPTIDYIETPNRTFSPGVEGMRQELRIDQSGSREVQWIGQFLDQDGNVVREYRWENPIQYDPENPQRQRPADDPAPEPFEWDGRDDDGEIVPDGTYTYRLIGRDRPGNEAQEELTDLRVVTEEAEVRLRPTRDAFSPGGNEPEVGFETEVTTPLDVVEWEFRVIDAETGETEYTDSGEGHPPDLLRWQGQDLTGEFVQDGIYEASLTVQLEDDIEAFSMWQPVVVDTQDPEAELALDHEYFGGETRPTVTLDAEWDPDAEWEAVVEITDRQFEGRRFVFPFDEWRITRGLVPFTWDGRDFEGRLFPDGEAVAYLRGEDAAGNIGESNEIRLVRDTRETPIDIRASVEAFSPEGDRSSDNVVFTPSLQVDEYIDYSVLRILDEDGEPVRTVEFEEAPEPFTWDGTDDIGRSVPDGNYTAELQVFYLPGNQPTATSDRVVLDTEAPEAELAIDPEYFGGETRPTVTVDAEWDPDAEWEAVVEITRREFEGRRFVFPFDEWGITPRLVPFTWDGRDFEGRPFPDGEAVAYLRGEDAAGNIGESNEIRLVRDTRATPISVEVSDTTLFPGVRDRVEVHPVIEVDEYIDYSVLRILDENREPVRTVEFEEAPEPFTWDGRDDAGEVVPYGDYVAELQVFYLPGNRPVATADPVLVGEPPEIGLEVPYTRFAPTGDGYRDTLPVTVTTEVGADIEAWHLVVTKDGEPHRTIGGTGEPPAEIEWDGRSDGHEVVDGYFDISFEARFADDGRVEYQLDEEILVDSTPPEVEVEASPVPFQPDPDNNPRELTITMEAVDEYSELAEWELNIYDPTGDLFHSFSGEGAPPEEITWDGRDEDGELVQSASRYKLELAVSDDLRNVGTGEFEVLVDIIVREVDDRLRIVIPSIHFEPNTAYLFERIDQTLFENLRILRRLAEILNEFEERDILIEGHANHLWFHSERAMEIEQEEYLIPLSEDRATSVRDALAILGVDIDRMTVEGVGGARPEVPFTAFNEDYDERWKNRRVEFWLEESSR